MSQKAHWRQPAKKRARTLTIIALVLGALVVAARFMDEWTRDPETDDPTFATLISYPLRVLELEVSDYVQTIGRKTPEAADVVIVGVDEQSLDLSSSSAFPEDIKESRPLQLMEEVFPWSREVYAQLIDRLIEAGARTVILDFVFTAPSTSHPEGDELFRKCLDRHRGKVIIAADIISSSRHRGTNDAVELPHPSLLQQTWPVDERIGFVTYWPDEDGVIRRTSFLHSSTDEIEREVPSFAAAILRAQGQAGLPPLEQPEYALRFGDSTNYKPVSLHEMFVPSMWESNYAQQGFFHGKTVFVGTVARQSQDFHLTPVGRLAGVQIHAQVFAAVRAGQFLRECSDEVRLGLIFALVIGAWALLIFVRHPMWCLAALVAATALGFVTQLWCFNHLSLALPMVVPLLGWNAIGLVGLTADYVLGKREKEALRRRIGRFHSPDMVQAILADPDDYRRSLAGAKRTICLLFSDVRGFTTMSENLPPEEMIAQLTEYLDRMVEVVFKHDGAIDKFIGDAVMAAWGRLRNDQGESFLTKDALDAVSTAVEMLEVLDALNAEWKTRDMQELKIGIGVHQGVAIVGELGSGKSEFTAIGDTVNSASRLEGATKQYGTDLIISDVVRNRVHDQFVCRSADLVKVKGKAQPMEVFTVQGRKGECDLAVIEIFENGVRLFRAGNFADALAEFEKARVAGLNDGLTAMYCERCGEMIASPPESWDGVWTMTKK